MEIWADCVSFRSTVTSMRICIWTINVLQVSLDCKIRLPLLDSNNNTHTCKRKDSFLFACNTYWVVSAHCMKTVLFYQIIYGPGSFILMGHAFPNIYIEVTYTKMDNTILFENLTRNCGHFKPLSHMTTLNYISAGCLYKKCEGLCTKRMEKERVCLTVLYDTSFI